MLKCLCCKKKRKIGFPLGLSDHVNMTIYDSCVVDDFGSCIGIIFKLMVQNSEYVIFANLIGFSSDTEQAVFHTLKPGKALLL